MIGLYLCNLDLRDWLLGLDPHVQKEAVVVPTDRFPDIVCHHLRRVQRNAATFADFVTEAMRLTLAQTANMAVDHPDQLLTVVHAMACAGLVCDRDDAEMNDLIAFIEGKSPWSEAVPQPWAATGVYSILPRNDALRIEAWIRQLDADAYADEVKDMHGAAEVEYYAAMMRSIMTVLGSTDIHGMDLCCKVGPPYPGV